MSAFSRGSLPAVMLAFVAGLSAPPEPQVPAAAQPCTDAAAAVRPGSWQENPVDLVLARDSAPSALRPAILTRLETIGAMFREAYPEPRGTAAEGYKSIRRFSDELDGGPAQYGYVSLYKTWMCVRSTGRIELADETGNWAYAQVNSLRYLLKPIADTPLQIEGRPVRVWMLARRTGTLRGETLYEPWMGLTYGRAVVFTHEGRVPWKPVSQQQYLDALTAWWNGQAAGANAASDALVRGLEETIAEMKRTLTGATRDTVIAEMERALADARAARPAADPKLAKGLSEQLKQIQDYKAAHSDSDLAQPAVVPAGMSLGFPGSFGLESEGGHMLVQVDDTYFRGNVPADTVQFIALLWRSESDSSASDAWRDSFERRFPLDQLKALIAR